MTVFEQVRQIVAEQHNVNAGSITPQTHFFNDLEDSLDFIEVVLTCEEHFDIAIPEHEAENLETVGGLVEAIEAQLGNKPRN